MWKEWPKVVPHPWAFKMALMWTSAMVLTIWQILPCLSCHENKGSLGATGTMWARFWRAILRNNKHWLYLTWLSYLGWREIKPGIVFAIKVNTKKDVTSFEVFWFIESWAWCNWYFSKMHHTQKAHITIAQIHASNGSSRFNAVHIVHSMLVVIGGQIGCLWTPCKFLRPWRDQLMSLSLSSDRGRGQPWARCQAEMVARYFWTRQQIWKLAQIECQWRYWAQA